MNKLIISLVAIVLLSGCSSMFTTINKVRSIKENAIANSPARIQEAPEQLRLNAVPELDGKKMTIAVYNFLIKQDSVNQQTR